MCLNLDKKKSKKELKKELIETKEAYKNLYTSENIDNKKELENQNNNNDNIDINHITPKNNVIKINLSSFEFEKNE